MLDPAITTSRPVPAADDLRARLTAFLAQHTTLTLATVGPDDLPAAAAVFYAHDADLNLYFLSEEETQHGKNLLAAAKRRHNVAGTIQADGQEWRAIRGVQVRWVARPGFVMTSTRIPLFGGIPVTEIGIHLPPFMSDIRNTFDASVWPPR